MLICHRGTVGVEMFRQNKSCMDYWGRHAAIFHNQGVERSLKDVENRFFGRWGVDGSNQLHLLVRVVEAKVFAYEVGGEKLHGMRGS